MKYYCRKCAKLTDAARFATYKDRHGRQRRRRVCWDCRNSYAEKNAERLREYRRSYNADNRTKKQQRDAVRRAEARAYVDAFKAVPCADCGKQWPAVAMDLDHVRGAKTADVARMVSSSYKLDLIKDELGKCEVVCACCHRLRTAARGQNLSPQSTETHSSLP